LRCWDVSSVTTMNKMFMSSDFNDNIKDWDVSSVTDMSGMFKNTGFNGNINDWDVSSVKDMSGMFYWAPSFNQCLSSWGVKLTNYDVLVDVTEMFVSTGCPVTEIRESLDGPWCQDDSDQCYATTCFDDDPNFQLNGVEHKTCDWVAKQKTEERCKKPGVMAACRRTCNPACATVDVDCTDDEDFRLGGLKAKTCEWVAKQKTDQRCLKTGVMASCRRTCNPKCGCRDSMDEFQFQGSTITCMDLDIINCDAEPTQSSDKFTLAQLMQLQELLDPIHQRLDAIEDAVVEEGYQTPNEVGDMETAETFRDLCPNKCKTCV